MENIDFFLSLVTEEPVTLPPGSSSKAFPGCMEQEIDRVTLPAGFVLGDFMEDGTVSVAEEVLMIDVSLPTAAAREHNVVWRVALKSGQVALMRLTVSGVADDQSQDITISGVGLVVEDLSVEPYVRQAMIEASRRESFNDLSEIAKATSRLMQRFVAEFGDLDQRELAANAITKALSIADA